MMDPSRGVGNLGDLRQRLRIQSALTGREPVTIAALGASVTADYGGIDGDVQAAHPAACASALRRCGRGCRFSGWLQEAVATLSVALPTARLHAVNCGMPGNPLTAAAQCLESHVPSTADVVVVDGATIRSSPHELEPLLRRLLVLPRAPAVLVLHLFHFCLTNSGCRAPAGVDPWSHAHMAANWQAGARMERDLSDLGAYYGLPVLSFRAAYYHAALGRNRSMLRGGRLHASQLTKDGLHPTRRGSRLIAALLSDYLLRVVREPPSPQSQQPRPAVPTPREVQLPPALYGDGGGVPSAGGGDGDGGDGRVAEQCFGWDDANEPPPEIVRRDDGWRLATTDHPAHRPASLRTGLVGTRPGATVVLRLPAVHHRPRTPAAAAAAAGTVHDDEGETSCDGGVGGGGGFGGGGGVGGGGGGGGTLSAQYLVSTTQPMGQAQLRCLPSHCSCRPVCLDGRGHGGGAEALRSRQPVAASSVVRSTELAVSLYAPTCLVALRVANASTAARVAHRRFKLTRLTLRSFA